MVDAISSLFSPPQDSSARAQPRELAQASATGFAALVERFDAGAHAAGRTATAEQHRPRARSSSARSTARGGSEEREVDRRESGAPRSRPPTEDRGAVERDRRAEEADRDDGAAEPESATASASLATAVGGAWTTAPLSGVIGNSVTRGTADTKEGSESGAGNGAGAVTLGLVVGDATTATQGSQNGATGAIHIDDAVPDHVSPEAAGAADTRLLVDAQQALRLGAGSDPNEASVALGDPAADPAGGAASSRPTRQAPTASGLENATVGVGPRVVEGAGGDRVAGDTDPAPSAAAPTGTAEARPGSTARIATSVSGRTAGAEGDGGPAAAQAGARAGGGDSATSWAQQGAQPGADVAHRTHEAASASGGARAATASGAAPSPEAAPSVAAPSAAPPGGVQAATPTNARGGPRGAVAATPDDLGTAVRSVVRSGRNRVELRLDPPRLGRLHIEVRRGVNGAFQVRLHAERAETAELLRHSTRQLEAILGRDGLWLERVDVTQPAAGARSDGQGNPSLADGRHLGGGQGSGAGDRQSTWGGGEGSNGPAAGRERRRAEVRGVGRRGSGPADGRRGDRLDAIA